MCASRRYLIDDGDRRATEGGDTLGGDDPETPRSTAPSALSLRRGGPQRLASEDIAAPPPLAPGAVGSAGSAGDSVLPARAAETRTFHNSLGSRAGTEQTLASRVAGLEEAIRTVERGLMTELGRQLGRLASQQAARDQGLSAKFDAVLRLHQAPPTAAAAVAGQKNVVFEVTRASGAADTYSPPKPQASPKWATLADPDSSAFT